MSEELDIIVNLKSSAKEEAKKIKDDLSKIGEVASKAAKEASKDFEKLGYVVFSAATNAKIASEKFKEYDRHSKSVKDFQNKVSELNKEIKETASVSDKATKEIKEFSSETNKAGKQTDVLGGMFKKVGLAIGAIFAGQQLSQGIRNSIVDFSDFQDTMLAVKAISNATDEEFKQLQDTAIELGRKTKFSSDDAAQGLKLLSQAGFTVSESIAAIPEVLNLATAGGLDLASAADIATSVLKSFNLEVDQLSVVNDELAFAANKSNASVGEIGEAFKYVGPLARGVSSNFEDLIAALASLHDFGIKGSMAGTTLRGALEAMLNPTKEETKAMEDLGKRIGQSSLKLRDSKGNFVGFSEVVKQLEKAGLDGAEALELFGVRAGPGMSALVSMGSDKLKELEQQLVNSEGSAQKMAETMDSGMGGALRNAAGALESFKIALVGAFEEEVLGLINWTTELFRDLTTSIKELEKDGTLDKWGDGTVAVVTTVKDVLGSLIWMFKDGYRITRSFWSALKGDMEASKNHIKGLFSEAVKFFDDKEKVEKQFYKINQVTGEVAQTYSIWSTVGEENERVIRENLKRIEESTKKAKGPIGNASKNLGSAIVGGTKPDEKVLKENLQVFQAQIKQGLDLVKEQFNTEAEQLKGKYESDLISLNEYFNERKIIVEKSISAEIEALKKLAESEPDRSRKTEISGSILTKQQELQTKLAQIDTERIKEQEKIDKDILKAQDDLNKAKVKMEEAFADQKERLAIQATTGLKAEFVDELGSLQDRHAREIEIIKDFNEEKLNLLKKQKADEIAINEARGEGEALINEKRNLQEQEKTELMKDQQERLTIARLESIEQVAGGVASVFENLYTLTGKKSKELFYLAKAAAIAEATINVAVGVTKALGQGGYLGGFMAAVVAAQGAVQIATIASQSFAEGGLVGGVSPTKKSDDKLVRVTSREFIQPVDTVDYYGVEAMEAIRKKRIPREFFSGFGMPRVRYNNTQFAQGGMVTDKSGLSISGRKTEERPIQIVNVTDTRLLGKYLVSTEGQRTVMNVIGMNRYEAKKIFGS